jgi:hypothetical protein
VVGHISCLLGLEVFVHTMILGFRFLIREVLGLEDRSN